MRWDVSPVVTLHFCTSQIGAACSVVVNVRQEITAVIDQERPAADGARACRGGLQLAVGAMHRVVGRVQGKQKAIGSGA